VCSISPVGWLHPWRRSVASAATPLNPRSRPTESQGHVPSGSPVPSQYRVMHQQRRCDLTANPLETTPAHQAGPTACRLIPAALAARNQGPGGDQAGVSSTGSAEPGSSQKTGCWLSGPDPEPECASGLRPRSYPSSAAALEKCRTDKTGQASGRCTTVNSGIVQRRVAPLHNGPPTGERVIGPNCAETLV